MNSETEQLQFLFWKNPDNVIDNNKGSVGRREIIFGLNITEEARLISYSDKLMHDIMELK